MALTVAEALARVLDGATPLETETVDVAEAQGRTLAAPLAARLTQPPFDASAMDGYAVRAADVARLPARLAVIGEAAAGHPFAGSVGAGEAVRIFTGAPVPQGADAVVIQENTRRDGTAVVVTEGTPEAGHVRRRGFDFAAGDALLAAGRRLGPRELSLAAAMGHGEIAVRRAPRVAVLATGDELVLPGETPGPGQIVCSNHLGVAALCRQAGAVVRFLGIARDTTKSLDHHIAAATDADVLVTIGGASVGDHDLVGTVLRSHGMALDFWKIAMRPGKPLMFGKLGAQRVLGLPGNPVSSLICARVFVVPLIAALLGRPSTAETLETMPAGAPIERNGSRQHYMRATVRPGPDGRQAAHPARSQDSSLLSPLAESNAFIVRPIDAPAVAAGGDVQILRLDF
ncbi:MAG: gephyrin-like molybdotransferase Glp [Hyphomicrobiaceae bacterium]